MYLSFIIEGWLHQAKKSSAPRLQSYTLHETVNLLFGYKFYDTLYNKGNFWISGTELHQNLLLFQWGGWEGQGDEGKAAFTWSSNQFRSHAFSVSPS